MRSVQQADDDGCAHGNHCADASGSDGDGQPHGLSHADEKTAADSLSYDITYHHPDGAACGYANANCCADGHCHANADPISNLARHRARTACAPPLAGR